MVRHTFLEFFAGGGMAREGLGAGWQCLFANDFDPAKAAAYTARWGAGGKRPGELKVGDVDELTLADLPAERSDLAWASFPCQDLSLAGAGAGLAGERSGSFMPFWSLILRLRRVGCAPRMIVLENVRGLLTSHGGQDFADICRMLQLGGYRFGALVMDAIDFLPQSRPRLLIVAVDDSAGLAEWAGSPNPHWHPAGLLAAHALLRADLKRNWLWFDPPIPVARNVCFADLVEEAPGDVAWHPPQETDRLLGMMTQMNLAKVTAARASKHRAVGAIYKRTRVEKGVKVQRAEIRFDVAGCLRTPGGGSSRQLVMVVAGGEVKTRLISARETARLMGLPDDYPLPARYYDAYHLTGDGVAVPVVRHIAEHILEPVLGSSPPRLAAAA